MSNIVLPTARDAAHEFLLARINYENFATVPYREREFRLDRMRELLTRLGDPDRALRIVHVAGTKGKGSTSAMIAAMLAAGGYRTGVFSSPHLARIEERMALAGGPCSSEQFVELVELVRPAVEAMDAGETDPVRRLTYFEITTAMSLVLFAREKVDWAVLEVGLGGRLDSTNVVLPRVSVITSISYDHMRQLGPTLASIAWEKAGIIKPGVPVVSGVSGEEPQPVIADVCRERGCELWQLGRDFEFDYHPARRLDEGVTSGTLDWRLERDARSMVLRDLKLCMPGQHQAANASVALATLAVLQSDDCRLSEAALRRGLSTASCPARVEVLSRRPTVVLDAAHNGASVAALLQTLEESFAPARKRLIFATSRDKDVASMLVLLLPAFDEVIFTRYTSNARGMPPEELLELAARVSTTPCRVLPDIASAWQVVRSTAVPTDLICLTGSFFGAAESRAEVLRYPAEFPSNTTRESA